MEPTHAGGLVYRSNGSRIEFLLVGPSKERPNEWILPKGHIEQDETPEQTAVREVREETGVTARSESPLGTIEFRTDAKTVRVAFYLMELLSQAEPSENRRQGWFSFDEAMERATHSETKALLKEAVTRLKAR